MRGSACHDETPDRLIIRRPALVFQAAGQQGGRLGRQKTVRWPRIAFGALRGREGLEFELWISLQSNLCNVHADVLMFIACAHADRVFQSEPNNG